MFCMLLITPVLSLDTLMSASSEYPEGLSSSPASWVVGVDRLERGGISALSCLGCIRSRDERKLIAHAHRLFNLQGALTSN